jgi:hypothetical protein
MRIELPAKARASSIKLRFNSLPNMDFQLMWTLLTPGGIRAVGSTVVGGKGVRKTTERKFNSMGS